VKLETFVFDALPLADRTMILEAVREQEFAPVKNSTGVDSVLSSRNLLVAEYARWLEAAGARIPRSADGRANCLIELSARHFVRPEDVAAADLTDLDIRPGDAICLP
jgi:UDP-N-acetylglucosamine/UDP-N-acetylgalactosamine diphosphorylase